MGRHLSAAKIGALMAAAMAAGLDRLSAYNEATQGMGYISRGKNKTVRHDRGGRIAFNRAAKKRRNQLRHKRACRG